VEGFEAFFRREFRAVMGLMYALSGSWLAADDIAQEAFIRAHRRWSVVGAYDEPGAWVRKVAIRRLRRWERRRAREAQTLARLAADAQGAASLPDLPVEQERLWQAVRALPEGQRNAIALYYYDGYKVAEIADILNLAQGTIKAQLHKGRQKLKEMMGCDEP
jgi:RNA polymerase sigma factor (sigma-70 family)